MQRIVLQIGRSIDRGLRSSFGHLACRSGQASAYWPTRTPTQIRWRRLDALCRVCAYVLPPVQSIFFFRTTSAIHLPKQHHTGRTDFELLDLSQSGPTRTGPSRREVGPITISSIWKRCRPNVKSDQSTMKFNVDVDIMCVCKLC